MSTSSRGAGTHRVVWSVAAAAVALVVMAAGAPGTALAGDQRASLAAEALTLPAIADTYVVAEAPTLAYGGELKLTAANWSTWHSQSYLRFQVPSGAFDRPVVRARVELTFQRLDHQASTVELRSLTGQWSETTTYATRPTPGPVLATFALPGQGTAMASFDVSAWVRATGTYEFAMTNPAAESVASVYAREHGADGPRLILDYGEPTLCGASFTSEATGETYQEALAREDGYYGGLDAVRVFYPGLPDPWPGKLDVGDRPMIVSFKAPPAEVVAGTHDAALRAWFAAAPTDRYTYWTYFHEPEDNIKNGEFAAADFRQAWQRIAGLADEAGNDRLLATLILMGWSLEPASGRDWHDYYPGRDYVDVLGWDRYNLQQANGAYQAAADMFGDIITVSRGEGLPFGIAETGSALIPGDTGEARAAWLREVSGYLVDNGALFALYFDLDWRSHNGLDYRIRDEAGMAAWREFCTR